MKTAILVISTVFAIGAVVLLTVMLIAELDPNMGSLFGMYPL